jgi:molybdopterin converting factor subunit 1
MRVLFFAQLKDVTGCDAVEIPLVAPLAGEQLWARLLEQFPGLAAHRANVRLACNWEYADAATRFADGDEAALIPPVSGG